MRFTVTLTGETDFDGWRSAARALALNDVRADDIVWRTGEDGDLFATPTPVPAAPEGAAMNVPREFIDKAQAVICHSDPRRFAMLYRLLLAMRTTPHLMKIASDPDVMALRDLEKSVRRDIHKMRAFVRFVRVSDGDDERFVAWFEPDHYIVERNAPFFVRRFAGMHWTILTPYSSVEWNGERLSFGAGATKADAPKEDASDALWKTYFANIFNPARLKVKAMQAEMPKKYWRNLPEASLIPDLIKGAESAARDMLERMPTMPAPHHAKIQERLWSAPREVTPDDAQSLGDLRRQAEGCRRCPLWQDATQTVFGEGPENARIVFVGEQPGDQEDIAGKPFVGPAGKVFDEVIGEAGIERQKLYVTNAVKHFKFEPRGKRRIHQKPTAGEVKACRWWLDHELGFIKPDLAVAMGATAAQSLLGKAVPIMKMRGTIVTRDDGLRVFLTIHPSYILRIREAAEAQAERKRFLADMRHVKELAG